MPIVPRYALAAEGAFMFKRILIANRGEIAVRIIRACREMGIESVAVFSDVDRKALHVRKADHAYHIGPATASESYLNFDKILDVARRSGAEAIHPGYGFLSENARFARACRDAGIKFIGPTPESMEMMGSKTSARQHMKKAGVPFVPGSEKGMEYEATERMAEQVGYPIMLKAAAGGGGKGMRLVHKPEDLRSAFENARSEAQRSFGDNEVYIEKAIINPRHVEMQIFGDEHGNVVYLGERECSVQRRHQKVLEESPSPIVDEDMRRRMGEIAVRVAKAANYQNAGTVEFLVDQDRNFYFLEMNTRLQVEHPVTEFVTGLDLVHLQFRVAAGEKLPFRQEDIKLRGHAIECRIYAEDPDNNFFPSPGQITRLISPSGPGIRRDSGMYEGWTVPIEYDPAAGQARWLRRNARPGHQPPAARAVRVFRRRHQDQHFAVPAHSEGPRFPGGQNRYRISRAPAEATPRSKPIRGAPSLQRLRQESSRPSIQRQHSPEPTDCLLPRTDASRAAEPSNWRRTAREEGMRIAMKPAGRRVLKGHGFSRAALNS